MNLHPAEFDPTPVLKKSIIQAPIMYPVSDAPAPVMFDYMGEPPSSGAELSMTAAPEAPMYMAQETPAPAPAMSADYAAFKVPPSPMDLAWQSGAPPMSVPSPSFAYASPSSRMGAPR